MAWIGSLDFLTEVRWVVGESRNSKRATRERQTLGGGNSIQVSPRTLRTWDMSMAGTSYPEEIAVIQSFVEGEHGLGPWWFVSDWAAVTNVLSPRASVLDSVIPQVGTSMEGGPLALPDGGRAGRSWVVESGATVFLPWVDGLEYLPVVVGRRVTASLYAQGQGGRLRLNFYDVNGSITRTVAQATVAGAGVERISLSATPLAGEVKMLLVIDRGVSRIARLSVSWTDDVRPWAVGGGAPMVHVSEVSSDVVLATRAHQYASAEFQIVEVG